MTILQERPRMELTRMPNRTLFTEWVMGIVGALAAGIGAWMYYVPTTWFLGGLAEGWPFGMFIGAGILLAVAFGIFARKAYLDDRGFTTQMTVTTVLALAALAGAVVFAIFLIV
jgi:hypothetical protein